MEIKDSFILDDLTQKPEEAMKAMRFLPLVSEHFTTGQKTYALQFWTKLVFGDLAFWVCLVVVVLGFFPDSSSELSFSHFFCDLVMSFRCLIVFLNDPICSGWFVFPLYHQGPALDF